MATSSPSIAYDNASDATFRTWIQAIDTALLAIGLTAVSQTGEVNFGTVLTPSAGNQSRGFRCYRFNDGQTEVYLKVEFGSGQNGALNPAMWWTLGYTLDGSGNFFGLDTSGRFFIQTTFGNNGMTATSRFCRSNGAIAYSMNEALSGTNPRQCVFTAGRTVTPSTGVPNSNYVVVSARHSDTSLQLNGSGAVSWTVTFGPGKPFQYYGGDRGTVAGIPHTNSTWGDGTDIGYAPIRGWYLGAQPTTQAIIGSAADHATGDTPVVSIYGTARTWRNSGLLADQDNFGRILHIWE